MILDLKYTHTDFNKDVLPFTRGGVFIDTSVMKIFIDGFIQREFSKTVNKDFQSLLDLFEKLKLTKWDKLLITPHIFTEICRHLCYNEDRNKRLNFDKIIKSIIPILKEIQEEKEITKNKILNLIDLDKPVIELGDLSIFVAMDDRIENSLKSAILVKDYGFNKRYELHPNIMVIDYNKTIIDLS